MAVALTQRKLDLQALRWTLAGGDPGQDWGLVQRGVDDQPGQWTVELLGHSEVDDAALQVAVDAAPDDPTPTLEANEATIRDEIRAGLDILLATVDVMNLVRADLATIIAKSNNQIGPADTKMLARRMDDFAVELKKDVRQMIRLTRIVGRELGSTGTGAA